MARWYEIVPDYVAIILSGGAAYAAGSVRRQLGPLRAQRQHALLEPFFHELLKSLSIVRSFLKRHDYAQGDTGRVTWAMSVLTEYGDIDQLYDLGHTWADRIWPIAPKTLQDRFPETFVRRLAEATADAEERDPEHGAIIRGEEHPDVLKKSLEDLHGGLVSLRDALKGVLYKS